MGEVLNVSVVVIAFLGVWSCLSAVFVWAMCRMAAQSDRDMQRQEVERRSTRG